MLGLRRHEGLDITRLEGVVPEEAWRGLEDDGLITRDGMRAVPTLRGRLLNDTIIERLFAFLD